MGGQTTVDVRSRSLLSGANHDIFSALTTAAALIEHLRGFADSRSVSKEDLKTATPLLLFCALYLRKDPLRISPVLDIHVLW
jgi:hypothetical protein